MRFNPMTKCFRKKRPLVSFVTFVQNITAIAFVTVNFFVFIQDLLKGIRDQSLQRFFLKALLKYKLCCLILIFLKSKLK